MAGLVHPSFLKRRLGEQLLEEGLLDEQQLATAIEYQREKNIFLGQALVSLGYIQPARIAPYMEQSTGFPFVDLASTSIDIDVARSIPEALARRKRMLPFAATDEYFRVAMVDPLDLSALDDIRARLNRRVLPYVAFESDVADAISRIYDARAKTQSVLDEIAEEVLSDDSVNVDELVGQAEDAPIVRLVNSIVSSAVTSGASDIHIEPQAEDVRVRFRQDGLLYEQATIPRRNLNAVVSRIKIISKLNIAERRRPQDGRFMTKDDAGNEFDMRVSILPLVHGEKVVMRILPKTTALGNAERLGLWPEQRVLFNEFISRPHGIMLVTGPTGSGKSTTLFAALSQINDSTRNINTVEDPVEYNLPGVNQMQVHPQIGVTFAAGLRTLLRQDPDVVMVGEIRDKETAEIAIQAALTGHLVLSTLHTNDAPGAVTRLQNMGVERFLISSALIGVIGQRLLRTVCASCAKPVPAPPEAVQALSLPMEHGKPPVIHRGAGCTKCGQRGMKGRTGVYEFMPMTDEIRTMVLSGEPSTRIRAQAVSEGMLTMRDSAVRKVLQGSTTPDEVARVLFSEDL